MDTPDAYCVTLPDGDCIGVACMHNPLPDEQQLAHIIAKRLKTARLNVVLYGMRIDISKKDKATKEIDRMARWMASELHASLRHETERRSEESVT